MNKHLLFCCFLFFTINCFGQQDLSLYGLNHLIDQQSLKPSYTSEHRFEVSIFPTSFNIFSNGPAYEDFVNETGTSNFLIYPTDKLSFGQGNVLRTGFSVETVRLIYQPDNWTFSLSHSLKGDVIIDYSGALLDIAIAGNSPYIGQNVPLDTDFSFMAYGELAFGMTVQLDNITIGGRFKYLSGQATSRSIKSTINLFTDDDIYQLFLDTDLEVQVAGNNTNSWDDINAGPISLNFAGNHGVGVDFGLDWQFNDALSFSVSVLDLGTINWKKSPRTYTANETFEFDGLSLGQLTLNGEEVFDFENVIDSLDIIEFEATAAPFSTRLPPELYVGLGYNINEKWRLNATGYFTSIQNNTFSSFSLGTNYQLAKFFNIGTTYGIMNKDYFLLGLNATFQLGPFQLYVLTDNFLGLYQIERNRTFNFRLGMGFSFGKIDKSTRVIPSL